MQAVSGRPDSVEDAAKGHTYMSKVMIPAIEQPPCLKEFVLRLGRQPSLRELEIMLEGSTNLAGRGREYAHHVKERDLLRQWVYWAKTPEQRDQDARMVLAMEWVRHSCPECRDGRVCSRIRYVKKKLGYE